MVRQLKFYWNEKIRLSTARNKALGNVRLHPGQNPLREEPSQAADPVRTVSRRAGKGPAVLTMERKIQAKGVYREKAHNRTRFIPSLLLSGIWLEKAGFEIGEVVTITVENGKIIIQ